VESERDREGKTSGLSEGAACEEQRFDVKLVRQGMMLLKERENEEDQRVFCDKNKSLDKLNS